MLLLAAPVGAWDEMLVLTTDYATYGGASTMERNDPWTVDVDVAVISADAVARWHDGLVYVVNRGASNLQVLDPGQGYATAYQVGLGVGRNPQDIVFAADGTAWIPCYDEALLLEVNPVDGSIIATYSTAAFADADGLPETSLSVRQGDLLAITCQRLDRNDWWQPAGGSQLLIFDLAVRNWIDGDAAPGLQGVILSATNPSSQPEPVGDGRRVRIGSAGQYGVLDGGIETVDLVARTSSGLQVTELQLGGDLLDFTVVAPDRGYAVISDAAFHTSLVAFDPRDGSGVATVVSTTGYDLVDVAFDGVANVYLCDRSIGGAGVRVFGAFSGVELTTTPLGVGRPPFLIVLPVDPALTAVTGTPPSPLVLKAPFPNPANPTTRIEFLARPAERLRIDIMDLRGRRQRTDHIVAGEDGHGFWVFDGRDQSGAFLPSGVYTVGLSGDGVRTSRSISLVR